MAVTIMITAAIFMIMAGTRMDILAFLALFMISPFLLGMVDLQIMAVVPEYRSLTIRPWMQNNDA